MIYIDIISLRLTRKPICVYTQGCTRRYNNVTASGLGNIKREGIAKRVHHPAKLDIVGAEVRAAQLSAKACVT